MDLYRRIAAIRSQEDADDLLDEVIDRYGDPPKGVMNLIDIALLRANARKLGICDIKQKANDILFTLVHLDFEVFSAVCAEPEYKNRLQLLASAKQPTVRFRLVSNIDSLKQAKIFINKYQDYDQKKKAGTS